ncbi:MAG: GNAT family N-acetyltransferase [Oscillospiraceae bacterium]|nr:GNAT family N-acetyltransferase [Oscillospiraceae bacterium]MBQ9981416.1 GNAT family N-acetyltransferase [Oscillospiraceae bacterium]
MSIRRAKTDDISGVNKLLRQVLMVHHNIRADIFKPDVKKYTDEQLKDIFCDENKPVFVATDESQNIVGYVFCIIKQHIGNNIFTDIKTLYIDDLCVDEEKRGMHTGKKLYEYALDYARNIGCYNVTLNVWSGNDTAVRFYEKCGMTPQKIEMEKIL